MPTRYQPWLMREFLGVNEDENPHAVGQNELTIASNTWKRGTTKGTRPGAVRDNPDYTANVTGPVQGLVEYRFANDASRFLVAISDGRILVDSTPSYIDVGATISSGASSTWTFAQHRQLLYGAGGAAGDWFWTWNGVAANVSQISVVNLAATAIYPRFVYQKWNRLFAAGFRTAAGVIAVDASHNPMVVRYSALNDGAVWPTANTIGGTSTIGGLSADGDEFITGFGEFTDNSGDWLLINTNKRLYAVTQTGNAAAPFAVSAGRGAIQNGCVHQNAFVSLGLDSGDAIYLSSQGIHSLRVSQEYGAQERSFLSWKIRRTFQTFNQAQLARAVGTYWRERGIVVFFVPVGTSQNLLGLCLDVKGKRALTADTAEWDFWQLGGETDSIRAVNALTPGRTTTGDYVIFGGNENGDVFTFLDTNTADLGSAYSVHFRTRHEDFGNLMTRKGIGDVYVVAQAEGDYTPTHRLVYDYGAVNGKANSFRLGVAGFIMGTSILGTGTLGSANPTTVTKIHALGSGFTIAHDFAHDSANEPFYITAVDSQVRVFGESIDAPAEG